MAVVIPDVAFDADHRIIDAVLMAVGQGAVTIVFETGVQLALIVALAVFVIVPVPAERVRQIDAPLVIADDRSVLRQRIVAAEAKTRAAVVAVLS